MSASAAVFSESAAIPAKVVAGRHGIVDDPKYCVLASANPLHRAGGHGK
jgi:hypothetical protein